MDDDIFFNPPTVWDSVSKRNVSRKSDRGKEILAIREQKKAEENKRIQKEKERRPQIDKEMGTGPAKHSFNSSLTCPFEEMKG
jgi:hypothetical protein